MSPSTKKYLTYGLLIAVGILLGYLFADKIDEGVAKLGLKDSLENPND